MMTGTFSFSIDIDPAVLVYTGTVDAGGNPVMPFSASGVPFSFQLKVTGGTSPYTWTAAGLPPGLTIASNGAISGTPTGPGSFPVTATVKDAAGNTLTLSFTFAVLYFDSQFVAIDVPTTIEADAVFKASITWRNTGAADWQPKQREPYISFCTPDNSETWGSFYGIMGQGTTCLPGNQFVFTSNFRAPSMPGTYTFQFQLRVGQKGLAFGELSAPVTITVVPSTVPPYVPPAIPASDPVTGQRVLLPSDITKVFSFRPPDKVGTATSGFSSIGLSISKRDDGSKGLMLNYDFNGGCVFDVDVPQGPPFDGTNAKLLPFAPVRQFWGPLKSVRNYNGTPYTANANGGILYDPVNKIVYWTHFNGYWTGGTLPNCVNATRLNPDGTTTLLASWSIPGSAPATQKWFWNGIFQLPKSFADKYTGGKQYCLGFGGGYSITAPCSRGPALGVIDDPALVDGPVTVLGKLLGYDQSKYKADRTGDYYNANVGYWGDQPYNRDYGYFCAVDACHGGCVIELPDKQAAIMFNRIGTNRMGYDYGALGSPTMESDWYFYDNRDLGKAFAGGPLNLTPYTRWRDPTPKASPGSTHVERGIFDEETRLIYVVRMFAYPVFPEVHPVIDVYQVA